MMQEGETGLAIVLGGGGVTGIAWMTGLLAGLADRGFDPFMAGKYIGTSAGATVAAQFTSGIVPGELYERQVNPEKQVEELSPEINKAGLFMRAVPALTAIRHPEKFRRRIGRMATRAKTVLPAARLAVIRERLPGHEWPDMELVLVAINAGTGELACFTRESGVSLVEAVAASCAVPGVWPTVRIGEEDYYDGGLRSSDNADLARGSGRVLVLSPMGQGKISMPGSSLQSETAVLQDSGSKVLLIGPDKASNNAMGMNPLDPARRGPAAEAGLAQGRLEWQRVGDFLS